ncbi:hypothetical protein C3F00_033205 [Pseudomonas sp. MWU13-2860]|nr:hypothetical protein C3F00_033205 [Pseudomonas sp. MWU13-2860]
MVDIIVILTLQLPLLVLGPVSSLFLWPWKVFHLKPYSLIVLARQAVFFVSISVILILKIMFGRWQVIGI